MCCNPFEMSNLIQVSLQNGLDRHVTGKFEDVHAYGHFQSLSQLASPETLVSATAARVTSECEAQLAGMQNGVGSDVLKIENGTLSSQVSLLSMLPNGTIENVGKTELC